MKYKKVTEKRLRALGACSDGKDYVVNNCPHTDSIKVVEWLIKEDKLDWANWLIVRVMERKQYLAYAIYSAEQVIDIYEKKYPDDKRPRNAIKAAEKVLKNDTKKNRAAAAAASAAYAAYDAADAAYDAADAAYDAADAAAKRKMRLKILRYGLRLLRS